MKYSGKEAWTMGDMWNLVKDDVFHGFHIKWGLGEDANLGHVSSKDLLHYTAHEDALKPLPEKDYPEDCLMKWTGCCMTGKDGLHYIYYTMRNAKGDEKIGVALSEDLEHFEVYKGNPVLEADPKIFDTTSTDKVNCRDLLVVYEENEDLYYGYFAAMADVGYDTSVGVIGVAKSKDLLNWYDQQIAYIPPYMGASEVPDVFFMDGKWYLTLLTGNIYGAKGISEDEDISYFTSYAVSDSPCGPFVHTDDTIFLGGNHSSGAVCRTTIYKGKRYVIYIDRGKDGASISLPKEVKVIDGKLRPCYTPILESLRTGNKISSVTADMITRLRSSHAWETVSGEIKASDNGQKIELSTLHHSYQKYRLENIKYPSVEIECVISGDCTECGFMFEAFSNDEQDKPKETSFISLNFNQKKVITYYSLLEYIPYSKRRFDFEKNKEYHIRAIVMEGIFEIYIDDVLILQGPMETADYIIPGFMCGNGKFEIKNLKIFELEK